MRRDVSTTGPFSDWIATHCVCPCPRSATQIIGSLNSQRPDLPLAVSYRLLLPILSTNNGVSCLATKICPGPYAAVYNTSAKSSVSTDLPWRRSPGANLKADHSSPALLLGSDNTHSPFLPFVCQAFGLRISYQVQTRGTFRTEFVSCPSIAWRRDSAQLAVPHLDTRNFGRIHRVRPTKTLLQSQSCMFRVLLCSNLQFTQKRHHWAPVCKCRLKQIQPDESREEVPVGMNPMSERK
jgi:hypothetical protein